jgi:hypothetical protein
MILLAFDGKHLTVQETGVHINLIKKKMIDVIAVSKIVSSVPDPARHRRRYVRPVTH